MHQRSLTFRTLALSTILPSSQVRLVSAAYACNGSIAQNGPPYISAFPPGATTVSHPPSGPTTATTLRDVSSAPAPPPTGGDGGVDYGQLGHDAVINVGFRHRRSWGSEAQKDDEVFECAHFQTCLVDGGLVTSSGEVTNSGRLFCYEPYNGEAEYEDGTSLNFATGTYYTPEGEKGNILRGPCPGSVWEEVEGGKGCRQALQGDGTAGGRTATTTTTSSARVASGTTGGVSASATATGSSAAVESSGGGIEVGLWKVLVFMVLGLLVLSAMNAL